MSTIIKIVSNQSEKIFYLNDYIEKNSKVLKKKYINYIEQISNFKISGKAVSDYFKINNLLNLWNCSLLEEKNILKSYEVIDCIQFIAISEIIKKSIYNYKRKKIITYYLQKNLISILKIRFPDIEFDHKNIVKPSFIYQVKKIILNNWLFSFVFFLFFLMKNQILFKKKIKFNNTKLILSYFCHYSPNFLNEKTFYTNHWKSLKKNINKKNFFLLNFFIADSKFKNLRNLISSLNKKKIKNCEAYNFIDYYFDIFDILNIVKYSLFAIKKFYFLQIDKKIKNNLDLFCIYSLSENQIKNSIKGYTGFNNFYIYFCFLNFFKKNKNLKKIFYLMENHSWEKLLLKFSSFNKVLTYGYIHSTMPFWHLNYYNTSKFNRSSHNLPNKILTSSKINIEQLRRQKISKKKIKLVESTRYFWLLNAKKLKRREGMIVFGDYDINLNLELVNFIKNFLQVNKNIKIYFKNHPANRINYQFNDNRVKIINGENAKYLYDYYLFSNSTSASAEYSHISNNIYVIHSDKFLNMSPLKDIKKFKKNFISNVCQLNNKITKNNKVNLSVKNFFYIRKNFKLWKKII